MTDTWESMAGVWLEGQPQRLWRRHSDRVNIDLVERWLPPVESVLKTDLFDEAVSTGLYPALAARAGRVVGIDASRAGRGGGRRRYPELEAVRADVRALPLADAELEAVVSNSTLDHFDDAAQIEVALGELARVLRPGGILLLTLDNPLNPIVAVTKALPRQGLNRALEPRRADERAERPRPVLRRSHADAEAAADGARRRGLRAAGAGSHRPFPAGRRGARRQAARAAWLRRGAGAVRHHAVARRAPRRLADTVRDRALPRGQSASSASLTRLSASSLCSRRTAV